MQELTLNMSNCHHITDVGVIPSSEILSKLPRIKILNLNLSNCKFITDRVMEELSIKLKLSPTLKFIDLNFEECSNITSTQAKRIVGSPRKPKQFNYYLN